MHDLRRARSLTFISVCRAFTPYRYEIVHCFSRPWSAFFLFFSRYLLSRQVILMTEALDSPLSPELQKPPLLAILSLCVMLE